ncbi:uracil-DNA glycosylase [Sporosarcina sp. NCCP-2716]|nr:uracil-DNA glycosylase [Sporosarcina sp. NCCP-2716]
MAEFCPEVWPEDPVPGCERDCRDCGLYTHGSRMVWGEGNPEAPVMVILDNPGAREDKEGQPMVCGTRQALQQAVYEAGLHKDQVYVTYILKRRPRRAYDKEETRHICMRHLNAQLELHKPKLLICFGNVAVQAFFHSPDADVKSMRGSFYDVDGWRTTVGYHPLAVRRRPNLYKLLLEDMQRVADELQ